MWQFFLLGLNDGWRWLQALRRLSWFHLCSGLKNARRGSYRLLGRWGGGNTRTLPYTTWRCSLRRWCRGHAPLKKARWSSSALKLVSHLRLKQPNSVGCPRHKSWRVTPRCHQREQAREATTKATRAPSGVAPHALTTLKPELSLKLTWIHVYPCEHKGIYISLSTYL